MSEDVKDKFEQFGDEVGELLPCPFCGSKAKTPRTAIGIEGEYVSCGNEDCPCSSYLFLVSQWNRRANFA